MVINFLNREKIVDINKNNKKIVISLEFQLDLFINQLKPAKNLLNIWIKSL